MTKNVHRNVWTTFYLVVSVLFTCVNKKTTKKSEIFIVKWEQHQLFLRCTQGNQFFSFIVDKYFKSFCTLHQFELRLDVAKPYKLLNRISFDSLPNLLPWLHNPADEKCLLKNTFQLSECYRIFQGCFHLLVTWGCCVEVRRSSGEPASSNWVMAEASSASSLDEFEASLSLATTTQRMAAMEIKAVANKTKPSMGLDHGQKCEWSPSLLPHLETRGTSRFRVYFGENTTLLSSRRGNSRGQ